MSFAGKNELRLLLAVLSVALAHHDPSLSEARPVLRQPQLPFRPAPLNFGPITVNIHANEQGVDGRYVQLRDKRHAPIVPVMPLEDLPAHDGSGTVGRGEGTAFYVSPCYLLTAFHAVFGAYEKSEVDERSRSGRPIKAEILIRLDGNDEIKEVLPVSWGEGTWKDGRKLGNSAEDIALLHDPQCLGRQVGWIKGRPGIFSPDDVAGQVASLGYPIDFQDVVDRDQSKYPGMYLGLELVADSGKDVIKYEQRLLFHTASLMPGNSGGPLVVYTSSGFPMLIGINIGTMNDFKGRILPNETDESFNIAIPAAEITKEMKRILRADLRGLVDADNPALLNEMP